MIETIKTPTLFSVVGVVHFRDPEGDRRCCGCQTEPSRFIGMINEFAEILAHHDDGDWRQIRPLTQRFHWNCAAFETQQAALAWLAGDRSAIATAAGGEIRVHSDPPAASGTVRKGVEPDRIILINGRLFTADRDALWAQALVIEGAQIIYVGSSEAALEMAGPSSRTIDLGGRLVIPGFNDAHMHHTPDPSGIRLPIDPLADPGLRAIAPMITEAATASPPGTWLMGAMGARLMNDGDVHRDALDAIAPDHPLIFLGFTNHRIIANSAALARLGLDDDAVSPVGGSFHRYPGSVRLNGIIDEYAMWGPQRLFAAMATQEEGAASLAVLGEDCSRWGITTLQNMSWTPVQHYLAMLQAADLPMRMRVIHFPPASPTGRILEPSVAVEPGLITVTGTKWILDGTPVERGAALGRGYADAADKQGLLNFAAGDVRAMLAEQRANGEQLLMHAIGRAAIEQLLGAVEADVAQTGADVSTVRIEHGDDASIEQIARIAALNLQVALNPCHQLLPHFFNTRYGDEDPVGAIRSFSENGIRLSFGSDGPLSPFIGLMGAVLNPVSAKEAISLEDALIAYTHGGAVAEGRAHEKGRLAPGYLADIAVLTMDLFDTAPDTWPGAESDLTIVDGVIMRDRIG